jgi:HNH endonuclease
VQTTLAHRFDPVGECIYCGSKENLSDEHIIPEGLGGRLILPKSSCPKCSKTTSQFELRLLRGHWWPHGRRLNLKSKRPKNQPNTFLVDFETSSGKKKVLIKPDEHPFLLTLDFDRPGILTGNYTNDEPIAKKILLKVVTNFSIDRYYENTPRIVDQNNRVNFKVNLDVSDYVRLLAKIGFSYAVGTRGLDAFESIYVRDLISGKLIGGNNYVGNASELLDRTALPGNYLHSHGSNTNGASKRLCPTFPRNW